MQKFNSVNELVNTIRPVDPIYCIRPNSIKSACGWFKNNFPGDILYAVKTNPNEKVIKINNQLYGLYRSAHKKTPENKPINIKTPPIVGVPIFLIRWSSGPSERIGFVIFFVEKYFINLSPIRNTIIIAVITAKPVLTVKKLKKFKNE